jgi:hypothetical protein
VGRGTVAPVRRSIILIVLLAVLAAPARADRVAEWRNLDSAAAVPAGTSVQPSIAVDGDGRVAVVYAWRAGQSGPFTARTSLKAPGQPWAISDPLTTGQVQAALIGQRTGPKVAVSETGAAVYAWREKDPGTGNLSVRGGTGTTGSTTITPYTWSSDGIAYDYSPSVVLSSAGTGFVLYKYKTFNAIFAGLNFLNGGVPTRDPNSPAVADQNLPATPNSFQDDTTLVPIAGGIAPAGPTAAVFSQPLNSSPQLWTGTPPSPLTALNPPMPAMGSQGAALAVRPDGKVVVSSVDGGTGKRSLWMTGMAASVDVTPAAGEPVSVAAAAAGTDGTTVVAFLHRDTQDPGNNCCFQVWAVTVDSDGTIAGPTQLAAGQQNARYPAVAVGPDGTAFVAWTQAVDGPDPGELGRRLTISMRPAGGAWDAEATQLGESDSATGSVAGLFPSIAVDATGRAIVAAQRSDEEGSMFRPQVALYERPVPTATASPSPSPGPSASPSPSTTPAPTATPAPTTAPVRGSVPKQSRKKVLRAGSIKVRCTPPTAATCTVRATVRKPRRGLPRTLGTGRATTSGGPVTVKVELSSKVRRKLKRLKGTVKVTLALTAPAAQPITLTLKLSG